MAKPMAECTTLKEVWDAYCEMVVFPKTRDPKQVENTRRVFYCGANGIFGLLQTIKAKYPTMSEEDVNGASKCLNDLQYESGEGFLADIRAQTEFEELLKSIGVGGPQ